MQDFEKLGAFYLGRRVDAPGELLLYDSKDLTTHAVILGMTGSGKTGLGVALIEEAALDHVPVIALDPKGDLGNLLLTFPDLRPEDFAPWIDPRAALEAGEATDAHAANVAAGWRQGLAAWGQPPERIARLRAAAEAVLYTPGSTAGVPISALSSLDPPGDEVAADADLYRETLDATASSLLTLAGVDADPLTSPAHVLLANVLDHAWRAGKALDLARLVAALESPPFDRLGVIGLDAFMPPAARFALAMRFNALLASPGFAGWLEGPPLDIDALLFDAEGKPRISVLSIAHLDDAGRMFFVAMLLSRLVAWMRRQAGTPSLRAVLYMDEVFGFMPPVANPPSKRLLLTLLKQARAHGLGIVLATQNPVDLDYKGLANAGTWFIGRMQTERDKARVADGLRSAAGGERLAPAALDATISSLGKRCFLLHNVHEAAPVVFETRWVMSYLAGPLTRDQIRNLVANQAPASAPAATQRDAAPSRSPPAPRSVPRATRHPADVRPVLPPGITERFLPLDAQRAEEVVYTPKLLAAAELSYSAARLGVDEHRKVLLTVDVDDDALRVDWSRAEPLRIAVTELGAQPADGARFEPPPPLLTKPQELARLDGSLKRWLRNEQPLELLKSATLNVTSRPGESAAEFRVRLQHIAHERRDAEAAKLRQRYETKADTLLARVRRAEHSLARERQQQAGHRMDVAVSVGTALLGAVLGRKRLSATTASRIGTAVRRAGRSRKEHGDVERAEENLEALQRQLEALERQLEADIDALEAAYDAQQEPLETLTVKPKAGGVHIDLIAIGWVPGPR